MVEKTKNLLSMIISGCAMVTLVLTMVFCLVTPESIRKSPNSLPADVATSSAVSANPLIKAGGAVDADVLAALLAKVDPLYASDSTATKDCSQINGGDPVTVKLFDDKLPSVVDGDKIIFTFVTKYWQPVYRTGNILTLWMVEPYTTAAFDGAWPHAEAYSESSIHDLMNNIYNTLNPTFNLNTNNFISTPNDLPIKWQTNANYQPDTTKYNSNNDAQNNLMDGGLESDRFWLPSWAEVFNNTNNATYDGTTSLWKTTQATRAYANNYSIYDLYNYAWLRSTCSGTSTSRPNACQVGYNGNSRDDYINTTYSVRPALHLNLEALQSSVGTETPSVIYNPLIKAGGEVSPDTLAEILNKIGGLEPAGSIITKDLSQINGGSTLTLKLFDNVADTTNDLDKLTASYWQVVYRTGNVLTLWMNAPYTTAEFDTSATFTDVYENSTIRTLLKDTVYSALDTSFGLNSKNFVVSPGELPVKWQTLESEQHDDTRHDSEDFAHNNLMDNGLENDKLWLPSHAEVVNNTMEAIWDGSASIWKTTNSIRGYINTTGLEGAEFSYLRSSSDKGGICAAGSYIAGANWTYSGDVGIRPALHIDLEALQATLPPTLTLTSESYGIGTGLDSEETDFNYTVAVRDSAGKLVFSLPISNMTPINITITLNRDEKYTIDLYGPSAVAFSFGMGDLMFATPHLEFTAGALTTVKIIPVKHDSTWSGGTDIL